MLGSDYPFPLGEQEVGKPVTEHNAFSESDKKRLLARNVIEFLAYSLVAVPFWIRRGDS